MNLWLRFVRMAIMSLFCKPLTGLEESRMSFMVMPHDCDLNFHLNNGRYLTMMDLGRFYLTAQVGLLKEMLKRRWIPVVAAIEIKYFKSLDPFMKFEIVTRALTWDEKYIYLEQRFERKGQVYSKAIVRAIFLGPRGKVSPAEVMTIVKGLPVEPPVSDAIKIWK